MSKWERTKKKEKQHSLKETDFVNVWVVISKFRLNAEGCELDNHVIRNWVHTTKNIFVDLKGKKKGEG